MVKTRNCRAWDIRLAYALQNGQGWASIQECNWVGRFFAPYTQAGGRSPPPQLTC